MPAIGRVACTVGAVVVVGLMSPALAAWSPQGHRLVALVASRRLTPVARQKVAVLLGQQTLSDVASWADQNALDQTALWHYVNIPPDATRYDRERDCPAEHGVLSGGPPEGWRDCVVNRIHDMEARLTRAPLTREDRATALKFLVHLVGDLHQPFHALSVERGGNGIPVDVFGSAICPAGNGGDMPCNLHRAWDGSLIAHRRLSDDRYLAALERSIADHRLSARATGSPEAWVMESHALAIAALLGPHGHVDEAYYRRHVGDVDERLALGGLRLAALINRALGP